MIYPWHQQDWTRITQSMHSLHHGLLIQGSQGTGVREFCFALSQTLLCEKTEPNGCGQCQNCRLFIAGSHPDFHVISSESEAVHSRIKLLREYCDRYQNPVERNKKARPSTIISIDQIRNLIERFSTHAHVSKHRVAVILPADTLNISAANALLKLLEEPPSGALFILGSADPHRLPKTILSRCLTVSLSNPSPQQSLAWLEQYMATQDAQRSLKLAQGGPLLAHQLFNQGTTELENYLRGLCGVLAHEVSPIDLASRAAKMDFEQSIGWLQRYVYELASWCQGIPMKTIEHQPKKNRNYVSLNRLFSLYDRISHYRRIARGTVNEQLAHEDLLLSLHRCSR